MIFPVYSGDWNLRGRDVDQRVASWWWGEEDDAVAYALVVASRVNPCPVACSLYLASVADDSSQYRQIKEWSYITAADLASRKRRTAVRNIPAVLSYRPEWGRQAARDGVALALWPHMAREVPGINARTSVLGCRDAAYQYIRNGVQSAASVQICTYRSDLEDALIGRIARARLVSVGE